MSSELATLAEILTQLDHLRPGLDHRTRYLASFQFLSYAPRHCDGPLAPWAARLATIADQIANPTPTSDAPNPSPPS